MDEQMNSDCHAGCTTPAPRSHLEPKEWHGGCILRLNACTAPQLQLPATIWSDGSHAHQCCQPTDLPPVGRSYGIEASSRCEPINDAQAWAARSPSGSKHVPLTHFKAYKEPHAALLACTSPGLSQESEGAAPLLYIEEANLVLQVRALEAQLHEPMRSAVRNSLYRLSRNADACGRGQSGVVRAAPMDGVIANLLFSRV